MTMSSPPVLSATGSPHRCCAAQTTGLPQLRTYLRPLGLPLKVDRRALSPGDPAINSMRLGNGSSDRAARLVAGFCHAARRRSIYCGADCSGRCFGCGRRPFRLLIRGTFDFWARAASRSMKYFRANSPSRVGSGALQAVQAISGSFPGPTRLLTR